MLSVNTNIVAMKGLHGLHRVADSQSASMERLSSGKKINNAKDDAAGLQISNRLHAQSRGMDVAIRNANDGISMLQTAEGALNEYTENLTRMRELTLRYMNGSLSKNDHEAIELEYDQLKNELSRVVETTSFAGKKLLNGTDTNISFQIGAGSGESVMVEMPNLADKIETTQQETVKHAKFKMFGSSWRAFDGDRLRFTEISSSGNKEIVISLNAGDKMQDVVSRINNQSNGVLEAYIHTPQGQVIENDTSSLVYYSTSSNSEVLMGEIEGPSKKYNKKPFYGSEREKEVYLNEEIKENVALIPPINKKGVALDQLDEVLKIVDSSRSYLGSIQNRFSHSINNLMKSSESVIASKSQIRDTDFAKETTNLTKQSILKEVGTSLLAQAKDSPRNAISLLS
ncbi:TPA: flagellin [Vibrio parahaemolyticus]